MVDMGYDVLQGYYISRPLTDGNGSTVESRKAIRNSPKPPLDATAACNQCGR